MNGRDFGKAVMIVALSFLCVGCAERTEYRTLNMERAQILLRLTDNYLPVDVRSEAEYDAGHIPGAILLPLEDIRDGRLEALPDREQSIMVYSETGQRSAEAAQLLTTLGYTRIYDIGGIVNWIGNLEADAGAEEAFG